MQIQSSSTYSWLLSAYAARNTHAAADGAPSAASPTPAATASAAPAASNAVTGTGAGLLPAASTGFLAQAMDQDSNAATTSSATTASQSGSGSLQSLTASLTSNDQSLYTAMTGYHFSANGGSILDANGNAVPLIQNGRITPAFAVEAGISAARNTGQLPAGENISKSFIDNMFATYQQHGEALPQSWYDNALAYLGGQGPQAATAGTPSA